MTDNNNHDDDEVLYNDEGQPLDSWDLPWIAPHDYLNLHPIPSQKIGTGLPTLDRALGGGIPVGSLMTIQGAPHAGKTSLAVYIATRAAMGAAADAYFYVPDEGARGTSTRIGQVLGLDRDKIAAGDTETMVQFGVKVYGAHARIRVLDPDMDLVTLERVLESTRKRAYGQEVPTILVFDSTQTLRLEDEDFDAERLRIGEIMNILKKATRAWDCIVINISHVNRGAYKHKKQEENINPLAGGAESATIERQSDIILHLDGDVKTLVTARCIKNRVGKGDKPSFQMRFDVDRATFMEVDEADEVDQKELAKERAAQLELEKLQTEIEQVLKKQYNRSVAKGESAWMSRNLIRSKLGLSGPAYSRLPAAAAGLEAMGVIEMRDGARGATEYRYLPPRKGDLSSSPQERSEEKSRRRGEDPLHLSSSPIGGGEVEEGSFSKGDFPTEFHAPGCPRLSGGGCQGGGGCHPLGLEGPAPAPVGGLAPVGVQPDAKNSAPEGSPGREDQSGGIRMAPEPDLAL